MTLLRPLPTSQPTAPVGPSRTVDVLVVGSCFVAPLNLLIVRSLTVYDVLVGVALVLLWRDRQLRLPPWRYVAIAYLFLLLAVLSSFRATYPSEALTQVLQYAFVFFVQIPVVLSVVRTRRIAVTSVALLCVGTLSAIVHAFITQDTQGAGRVLVFYSDNPNRLGYPAVYLLPLLLVLWHVSRDSSRRTRLLTALAVGVGLYFSLWAVTASGSRSSLAGCVGALVIYVVVRPGLTPVRAVGRVLGLGLATVVVVAGLVTTGQLPNTLEERIDRSIHPADVEDSTGLVADREHLMNAGVRAFMDSPFLGTGLDNFRYVTTDYDLEATPQLPHNLPLQLLVQVGLIGTLAFAAYLAVWGHDMWRGYRRLGPPDTELVWGLVASLAGILTIFMFAPEMLDRHYWLVVALGLAVVIRSHPSDTTSGRDHD